MAEMISSINGVPHIIIDNMVIDNILLADSFIFNCNKLSSTKWNGEARLYIWSQWSIKDEFFWSFQYPCFFLKEDLLSFLHDAEMEYKLQEQWYRQDISMLFSERMEEILNLPSGKIYFHIYPAQWTDDTNRYYIRSDDEIWKLLRKIALPNLSYLSIMQLLTPNHSIELYFRLFMNYEYNSMNHPKLVEQEEEEITDSTLPKREKSNIRQARVWQWDYRRKLLEQMPNCPITWVSDERFLIASHIKPWAKSNDKERIDPFNGFMFTPNIDRLFDQWFITFNKEQQMLISPWVSPMNKKRLWIIDEKEYPLLQIRWKRADYLNFHRSNIFKK